MRRRFFKATGSLAALFIAAAPATPARATAGIEVESKLFVKQKIYSEDLYVMNDYLEFAVFDMSKLNLFINAKKVDLVPPAPSADATSGAALPPPAPVSAAESEIKAILPEIPKYFYQNLKNQIIKRKVPLTLYAADAPAFAKPLKLYVKLKKISLSRSYTDKKGASRQPVAIQIYGQIKEKKGDKLLTRFYDTEFIEFELGKGQAGAAFDAMSDNLMKDLAAFLETKY